MYSLNDLEIVPFKDGDAIPYDMLLLSDDTVEAIDNNLKDGELYIAKMQDVEVGAFVLKAVGKAALEIKNIAISEALQGQGIGSVLLSYIINLSKDRGYSELLVGTCDQCFKEIKFYQKSGFELFSVRENFFIENYDQPIFENGIQIKDMVMLSIGLQSS